MEEKITKKRKTFKGIVVSDKMDKTIVVKVDRYVKNPKYGKYIIRSKNFKAHDPEKKFKIGDTVTIKEVKPISKDKTFHVIYQ